MEYYGIQKVCDMTGVNNTLIKRLIREEKISLSNGKIPENVVCKIADENKKYINMREYASSHNSNQFHGNTAKDRNNLLDTLEVQEFFGIEIYEPTKLLIGNRKDILYFQRSEVPFLDSKLKDFFQEYGLTEEQKIRSLLKNTKNTGTAIHLKKYLSEAFYEKSLTTSVTEFVRLMLQMPALSKLTDEYVAELLKQPMYATTKDLIINFLNYVKKKQNVKYNVFTKIKTERSNSIPAYQDDTYLTIATYIFNADYIADHNMIEKALDNHLYAEMWLYLAIFFCCGWRAQDVCNGWQYPKLYKRALFGICTDTLYNDILEDNLPDEIYIQVCKYSLGAIDQSGRLPSKTASRNPSPLKAVITPGLYTFYGLLTLIAEMHMLTSGDGYMKSQRAPAYQNKINLRDFFGRPMWDTLGGQNIQSRRLNKDFLQGVEKAAREQGCGGVMSSAVASYARNHTSLNTIRTYLQDHRLTGENADMVLYYMMERGVFGFELYQTLITAYPDAMRRLTLKEQNQVIEQMNVTPLQLEEAESGVRSMLAIQTDFKSGNDSSVLQMLKSMYEISQNRGKGKDQGVYCLLRAEKMACQHAEWDSCLANGCPYLVFTKIGYLPLLRILLQYQTKANKGNKGNKKAQTVLRQVLIPRYQKILNQLMKDMNMSKEDRNGLKLIMKETLNG